MATEPGGAPRLDHPRPTVRQRARKSRAAQCLNALLDPIDPASLAAYRFLLGGLMALATVRFWAYGWIEELYLEPSFHFSYPGGSWIVPWPAPGMYAHFALVGASALGLCLGAWTRVSAALFCVAFTYVELIDKATYLNHYYFVSLMALLLACVPSGAVASLDARWRGKNRPPPVVRRWHLALLQGQVAIVYLHAGLAKLDADWLLRAEPLTTWLAERADFPLVGGLLAHQATAYVMSWLGATYDCSLPLLLLLRRTRAFAFAAAVAFHVSVWLLFPIGIFSWVMIASTTLFFEPSWPRRLARWLPLPRGVPGAETPPPPASAPRRWGLGAAALYLVAQSLLPLRHLAYPGPVNWHEQGFRFSWRVMLIEKTGQVDFDVLADGKRFKVYPRDLLTPLQYRMMRTQPDMIQQMAWLVRDRFRQRGHRDVRVFANAWASLNGRPSQRLIDPEADLAKTRASLGHAAWIVPLEPSRLPARLDAHN